MDIESMTAFSLGSDSRLWDVFFLFFDSGRRWYTCRCSSWAKPGPWTLIMIAFGVDPMTGRAAAYAAGHGFFAGWAIAIAGDMIFFTVIMASTIWLNGIFGNSTLTAVVILICMFGLPPLVQRFKK